VIRRLFWVGVGVVVTVVIYRQGRKLVRRYVPASVAERAEQVVHDAAERTQDAVADFRETFTQARARRESELMAALLAEGQSPDESRAARFPRVEQARRPEDDEAEFGYSF
jgi:hypothetical protein